jgi:hypothetical protein
MIASFEDIIEKMKSISIAGQVINLVTHSTFSVAGNGSN